MRIPAKLSGIKSKLDDPSTGPILNAVWMDAYLPNIQWLRDQKSTEILSDKMALIAPFTDISSSTFNEIMGATIRALSRHYIPGGVRDYFEMARRSNYKKGRRIPVAMMKLDACLATVAEATCPPSAKQQLRTFLASHNGSPMMFLWVSSAWDAYSKQ